MFAKAWLEPECYQRWIGTAKSTIYAILLFGPTLREDVICQGSSFVTRPELHFATPSRGISTALSARSAMARRYRAKDDCVESSRCVTLYALVRPGSTKWPKGYDGRRLVSRYTLTVVDIETNVAFSRFRRDHIFVWAVGLYV
jgi:hypothetical protein